MKAVGPTGIEQRGPCEASRLLAPDRRFFVVGDQVSQLPGWQEGNDVCAACRGANGR